MSTSISFSVPWGDPQQLAYVGRMHDDVVLDRSAVPEALQKSRRVATSAHRVHDYIRSQLSFGTAVAADHPRSGDAIAIRRRLQLGYFMAAQNRHVPNRV